MAAASSASRGSIDGKPVSFSFTRNEEDSEQILRWTEARDASADSEWNHVPESSILAVIPGADKNAYILLYVEACPEAQKDEKTSPVNFRSSTLTGPPPSLLDALSLPLGRTPWDFGRSHENGESSKLYVIVSTRSGTGLGEVVWTKLMKPFLSFGGLVEKEHYDLLFTSSESSVLEFTETVLLPRATAGLAQILLLMSGDGGLLDVANKLLSGERSERYRMPSIAVLPLGTGNALAHSAGIGSDSTLGLKTLARGSPKELPLFAATFSPGSRFLVDEARQEQRIDSFEGAPTVHGAVVCSWGLHATLVADSDTAEFRKFGAERFKMAGKEAVFPSDGSDPHHYTGEVSMLQPGQQEWQSIGAGEHGYVLVTPVSQLEKGFMISPASKPLDGKLWLIHFGTLSGQTAMEIMTKAYTGGQHVSDPRIRYEEIAALRIEFKEEDARWRRVCVDGKIIRVEQGGWVEVRAGQKDIVEVIVQ